MKPTSGTLSAWACLRRGAGSLIEDLGPFVVGNLVVCIAAATSLLAAVSRPLAVLGLLAIPAMAGVTRMAWHAVQGDRVRISQLWAGARYRWAAHLGLGTAQIAVLAVSAFNVRVGLAAGSVIGGAAAVVSLYVGLAVWSLAVVAWPSLVAPTAEGQPVHRILRSAAVAVLRRPLHCGGLALVLGLLVVATVQTVAPIALAPAFIALASAHAALGAPAPPRASPPGTPGV